MNPTDFVLLFGCTVLAGASLVAHGWGVNGIGPAVLALAGGLWNVWMQWLRHRSWLRHRDSGFAPGTQHLSCLATLGFGVGVYGAVLWLLVVHLTR